MRDETGEGGRENIGEGLHPLLSLKGSEETLRDVSRKRQAWIFQITPRLYENDLEKVK